MSKTLFASLAAVATILFMGLASCGGHEDGRLATASRGRVVLTIAWPATRAIPPAARSIKIVAVSLQPDRGQQVGQVIVPRPADQATSQAVLEDLPSVKVRLTATAHTSADGTGEAIAAGSTDVNVPENNSVAANITLDSTAGCVMPAVSAYANAVNDQGNDSLIDAGQKLTASSTRSGSFPVGVTPTDPGVRVATGATASVNRAQLTGSILNIGRFADSISDTLIFDAPGKTGQAGQATIVMNARATTTAGATASTYSYSAEINGDNAINIHGSVIRGNQNNDPPPSGDIRGIVHFVYGQQVSFFADIDYSFDILDPPGISNQLAHWKFVKFEGLPTGATIRSLSCDPWPGGAGP